MTTSGIKQPQGILNMLTENGDTFDIIQSVISVVSDKKALDEVSAWVHQNHLTSRKVDLKRLWRFVHDEITYEEDGDKQFTQYPSNLIFGSSPTGTTRAGDCKSKTAFIAACLQVIAQQEKSIDAIVIRFCTYAKSSPYVTHVYPCVVVDGELIILDAVWHQFDEQKQPMYRKADKVINYNKKVLEEFLKLN